MELIDSHCHIDAEEFDTDRDEVLERARSAGVSLQIVPAVTAASWPKLRDLAQRHPELKPAYGLHPVYQNEHRAEHLAALARWIDTERPLAIGECGLDFYVPGLDGDAQRECFRQHLRLARDFDLPLVLHARRAVEEVIQHLRQIGGLRGVVHSFGGSAEQAKMLHRLGFFIGIGGPLTYPNANRLRALIAGVPLEQLLLETDAPDQPDAGHRGQRNEPARLRNVLDAVAAVRGESPERIAEATSANARALFGIP